MNADSSHRPTARAALVGRHRTSPDDRGTPVWLVSYLVIVSVGSTAVGLAMLFISAVRIGFGVEAGYPGIVNYGMRGLVALPILVLAWLLAIAASIVRRDVPGVARMGEHPIRQGLREVFIIGPVGRISRRVGVGLCLAGAGVLALGIWLGYYDVFGWEAEL